MAQMILSSVGTAIGGPIGGWIGRTVGRQIDRAVTSALTPGKAVGRRLTGLQLNTTAEGEPLPAGYGRVRLGGQIIWAARFLEHRVQTSSGGGKSTSGAGSSSNTYRYTYSLSFAWGRGRWTGSAASGRTGSCWTPPA